MVGTSESMTRRRELANERETLERTKSTLLLATCALDSQTRSQMQFKGKTMAKTHVANLDCRPGVFYLHPQIVVVHDEKLSRRKTPKLQSKVTFALSQGYIGNELGEKLRSSEKGRRND